MLLGRYKPNNSRLRKVGFTWVYRVPRNQTLPDNRVVRNQWLLLLWLEVNHGG